MRPLVQITFFVGLYLTTFAVWSQDVATNTDVATNIPPPPPDIAAVNPPPEKLNLKSPLDQISSAPDALDLPECFRKAAVRSDTLQISEQDIRIAKAHFSEALANIYPTFRYVNSQTFQDYRGGNGSSAATRPYSSANSITLSQTLFNGFANYNAVGAGEAEVAAQQHNLERAYQTLYEDVASAFYQILLQEGDLVILEDNAEALQARDAELRERVRIGRSRPADLLSAQVNLASTKVTIEETKGLLAAARELMAFYIGIPADKIHLKEKQKFPAVDTLEKYLQVNNIRPDILALVESEREAQRNLSVQKGALYPTATVNATYNIANDPSYHQDWNATFEVSLPLFDGGLIISQINQQKALVRQSELNLESLRRSADQDVRTAFAQFNSSVAQDVRLKEEVKLAAANYEAQLADYRVGVVALIDVLTALSNFETSRLNLHSADLTARLNLIQLHVAAGMAAKSLPNGAKSAP